MLTEALLAPIAEAVFRSWLEHAGLAKKTYAWLGYESHRLAFQVVLTRTFSTFARAYPQWITSLFDEHFLTRHAGPLLTRALLHNGTLIPVELATIWVDQMKLNETARTQFITELTPIASNFLRWLEAELRIRPELRPILDNHALDADAIAESSQQTVQAQDQLRTELKAALSTLQQVAKYQVTIQQAKGIVIGDFNTVVNHFITGIRDLPTDYAARVKNFLIEYLGTPRQPVPFGGRTKEFTHLNSWLDGSRVPPYLLLAAPAGMGKSALLARWSQTLLERHDLAVAYFPVSIRFRTNLAGVVFPSLTARLANLHSDKVPTDLNVPEEVWRGLLTDYLTRPLPDGRSLVLILDGLDEAADWEAGADLFPLDPPPGLRIVLSARYLADDREANTWLSRLGWMRRGLARTLPLYPLNQAGVAEVLRQMSFPLDRLSRRVDIVAELYRLSEGDPLLVRLYVDDLWERGEMAVRLQPEDLRSIHPGLSGYFDRWWEDQRRLWGKGAPLHEPAVQALLNLLACALGPLSRDDLLRLVSSMMNIKTWDLELHLESLKRFVIGDGKHQGYAFTHPRLGNYFYEERLSKVERQEVESCFLKLGEETLADLNEGRLQPEQASPYIVQYYSSHLERMDCNTELRLSLICDGWRQAWEKLEGSYTGFLNDIERAWRAAERDDKIAADAGNMASYIGREVHCVLCRTSVNSLAKNTPPTLLAELVKRKIWTSAQGLAYARQIPDSAMRAKALALLVPYLPNIAEILQEALEAAQAIEDKNDWAKVLADLASRLSDLSYIQEALEAARAIEDEYWRARTLVNLGYPQESLETVQTVTNQEDRTKALDELNSWLSEVGYYGRVNLTKIKELPPHLPEDMVSSFKVYWRWYESEFWQAEMLESLAPYLSEKRLREMLRTARMIRTKKDRAKFLEELAKLGYAREALEIARAIEEEEYRAESLARLAPYLFEELLREALEIARAIEEEEYRAESLARLAPYLSEKLRDKVMQEVLEIATTIEDEEIWIRVLVQLAPFLPEPLLREVLEKAQAIRDEEYCANALEELASCLATMGYSRGALEIAMTIEDEECRAGSFKRLAPYLSKELLWEALELVQAIRNEECRAEVLAELASRLIELGYPQEALEIAGKIEDEEYRAEVLVGLAPHVPEELQREVLKAIKESRSEHWLAEALSKLASYLAEPLLQEALQWVQVFTDKEYQSGALAELALRLVELGHLQAALRATQAIANEEHRVRALVKLAPRLAELGFPQKAIEAVQMIKFEYWWAETLKKLILKLAELGYLQDALELARTAKSKHGLKKMLMELVPYLPEKLKSEVLQEMLVVALGIVDEEDRIKTLVELASYLPKRLLGGLLEAAQAVESKYLRANLLASLAPYLSEESLRKALEITTIIEDEEYRVKALIGLVIYLPKNLLQETLGTSQEKIRSEYWKAKVLALLSARLGQLGYAQEALKTVQTITSEYWQAEALVELIPSLPKLELAEALETAKGIVDEQERAKVLVSLSRRSAEVSSLADVLANVRRLQYTEDQAKVLMELLPSLPKNLFREVLGVVKAVKNEEYRIELLTLLVSKLAELGYLQEALEATRAIEDEYYQVEVLGNLVFQLKELGYPQKALEIAQAIEDEEYRLVMLDDLALQLAELGYPQIALAATRAIEDEYYQVEVLVDLVSYLPESLFEEVLLAIWKMLFVEKQGVRDSEVTEELREKLLSKLVPHLAKLSPVILYALWRDALHVLAGSTREDLLVNLSTLSPIIISLGGARAVTEASQAILEVGEWWP